MDDIDYDHAFALSERCARHTAVMAMEYALDSNLDDNFIHSDFAKFHPLNTKQWERLCTYFVVPNEQLDPKLNFNIQGSLSKARCRNIMKFIQVSVQPKVLEMLLLDHDMSFAQRQKILQNAVEDLPSAARWQAKTTMFAKNYTCELNKEHFRYTIQNFIGHHLSKNHNLLPYKVEFKSKFQIATPVKKSSRTSSTGPM